MNTSEVIQLAQKHVNNDVAMKSSAQLCLKDAESLYGQGKLIEARARALRSLQYSVGVFHEDYRSAKIEAAEECPPVTQSQDQIARVQILARQIVSQAVTKMQSEAYKEQMADYISQSVDDWNMAERPDRELIDNLFDELERLGFKY